MNLLFYRYGSICEPDIIEAFHELGHSVSEITDEITNKELSPQDCIQTVSRHLLSHPADFVFSVNFFPALSEVCNIFKIPYLCWIVDSPVMELYSTSITNPYNRIFLFDDTMYQEHAPRNPACIFYLPLATNVRAKDRVISAATPEIRSFFSADISFVGSLYTEKCPYDRLEQPPGYLKGYLDAIMAAQQSIYGYYFIDELLTDEMTEQFKAHFPHFYRHPSKSYLTDKITLSQLYIGSKITALERLETMDVLSNRFSTTIYTGSDTSAFPNLINRGFAKSLTEMPIIFHESKINLNTTSKPIRSGLPLRIWDILGSGGFVLSNYQSELPSLLSIGRHLDCYASMEELTEKCEYYLSHEKERRELAQTGYEEVKAHHTFPIRISEMLSLAFRHPDTERGAL